MAFKIQVQDVQNDVAIKKICGVRTDSDDFFALLNEVEKALMLRGGWFDTEHRFTFCLSGCHIVWPEFVGTILAVRFCRGGVALSQNNWYSFSGHGRGDWGRGYGGGGYGGYGYGDRGRGDVVVIEDANMRPCYGDLSCGTGSLIRYYVVLANDIGRTVTLFGKSFGAQPLQEQINGVWQNGLTLTAANPYVQTVSYVTEIQSVVRQPTQGMAYLYEYNPECDQLRDIAQFQPSETHPRYRSSRILNINGRRAQNFPNSGGCCWTKVEALVKMQFVPLVNERDFIPVDNLRALKLGIQAVKLEEKNQDADAVTKWAEAVHELNLENFDRSPDEQIVFQNQTFSGVQPRRQRLY